MRVAVIGGGPAGLVAAGSALGAEVVLFEHNDKLGKKIYITGKGRCNFTNVCAPEDFLANVVNGGMFLRSALSRFTPEHAVRLLEDNGCKTKLERGRRAFPQSDKASDVTKALSRYAERNGTSVRLCDNVTGIKSSPDGISVECDGASEKFDRVIVCTGGKSYSLTGSDGSGYVLARGLGHAVNDPVPSLLPLVTKEDLSCAEGLTLKNIAVSAEKIKPIRGDMMITGDGVSGPVILTLSALCARRGVPYEIAIDLKPAMSTEELDDRILRDFDECKNKQFKNSLDMLLPKSMIPIVIKSSGISSDKQVNSVTKSERAGLVAAIKALPLTVVGNSGFERAVVTCGGVDLKQINPKTMESKIASGVHFAGEVLDIDALTGGYNFHIAMATGYAAGSACAV